MNTRTKNHYYKININNKGFSIIYVILFLFYGCSSDPKNNLSDSKTLPAPTEIEPIINGEYFCLIEPIALETKPECQIGRIDKYTIEANRIFILDYSQKVLFIFNQKGKFLNKINRIGKGPGEYKVLADFWIDSLAKTIEILDRRKIIKYNYEGMFVDEMYIEVSAFNFAKTKNENYYIWAGSQTNRRTNGTLNLLDNDGKLIAQYFNWDGNGRLTSQSNMFTKNTNGILFRPFNFDYVLRELDDNGVNDKYIVDFGYYSLKKDYLTNLIDDGNLTGVKDDKELINYRGGAFRISNMFETKSYIYFRYLTEGKTYFKPYIYSKDKNKGLTVGASLNENALLPQSFTLIDFADPKSNTFYKSYDAYLFLNYSRDRKTKMVGSEKWENIVPLLDSLTPNSNPIIFKFKINEEIFDKY